MNFEAILEYFTKHVEVIIQWLFLLIIALTGFLVTRGLFSKKPREDAHTFPAMIGNLPEIEGVLKQILERTTKLESVTVQQMSPETAALAETQVRSLKKELASRDEELKALKASGGGAGGAGEKVSEEASALAGRLKELESKLAEYEILEDDIADLSLYKEENARLRSELDKTKGAPAPMPAARPAPTPPARAPAPTAESEEPANLMAASEEPPDEFDPRSASAADAASADPTAADDIVAEFAEAVSAEAVADGPDVTIQVPDTGNPMQDFEAAVKIEKKKANAPAPVPVAAVPVTRPPPPAKPTGAPGESDDIFAEFSEPPPQADPGGLDTDKMMAEMAALVNLEPSSGSALDEGVDTDKMAAEAGSLQKR